MPERIRINRWDWLLIIGFVLAPMDSLRFLPKIGLAEMTLGVWSVRALIKSRFLIILNDISRFWILFLICVLVGSFAGIYIAPQESTAIPDYFIYVFLALITISITNSLIDKDVTYYYEILKKCALYSSIVYFLIYLDAKFGPSWFLGATLWFGRKFTGGAENPNKLAVFICEVFFIQFFVSKRLKDFKFKSIIIMLLCVYIGLQTQSSMFIVAMIGSIIVSLYVFAVERIKNTKGKIVFVILTFLLFFIITITSYRIIYSYIYNWISLDSNGLKRFDIFSSFKYSFAKSPIVGLGPGMHALNGLWTYHNAYLEIWAMSGTIGLLVFIAFILKILNRCRVCPEMITLFIPLLIFGMGSFAVRNIEFWFVTAFVYLLSIKIQNEMSERNEYE